MLLSKQITDFLFHLDFNVKLPRGVNVLNCYPDPLVQEACVKFYSQFYGDTKKRTLLMGINPGRFGAGITGIPFTDPVVLETDCSIPNSWKKQAELSAQFIYEMIAAYGGPRKFYKQFYISAVSPLGFVKANKNLNYYDDPVLLKRIEPFAVTCIRTQLAFGLHTHRCICIGEGENFKFLQRLNEKYQFFQSLQSLPHPRFILQYRRKEKQQYIDRYLELFSSS
jgi:hypothetical protein